VSSASFGMLPGIPWNPPTSPALYLPTKNDYKIITQQFGQTTQGGLVYEWAQGLNWP
jgi:hypothetical protein